MIAIQTPQLQPQLGFTVNLNISTMNPHDIYDFSILGDILVNKLMEMGFNLCPKFGGFPHETS